MEYNKKYWYAVGALVIVILIFFFWNNYRRKQTQNQETNTQSNGQEGQSSQNNSAYNINPQNSTSTFSSSIGNSNYAPSISSTSTASRSGLSFNRTSSAEPNSLKQSPVSTQHTAPAINQTGNKLSYGDAIMAYPYRFQFSNCSGWPGTIAIKQGAPLMLDNRDNSPHTIVADGQTFLIGAYDYQIIYPEIIGLMFVTCDGGGAAMTNVQF